MEYISREVICSLWGLSTCGLVIFGFERGVMRYSVNVG
jgi:hypothetical protein